MDVGFVVDASGIVGPNLKMMMKFVQKFITKAIFKMDKVRASVTSFCATAKTDIKFNEHDSVDAFAAALEAIPLIGGNKVLGGALEVAADMFKPENGARPLVPKVMILLVVTDPQAKRRRRSVSDDPMAVADKVRKMGINIIVVAVQLNIRYHGLGDLAGPDKNKNVFTVGDYEELVDDRTVNFVLKRAYELSK